MPTVNINSQEYEVPEEVAEQFSKFIRRANAAKAEIQAGLDREEGMLVALDNCRKYEEALRVISRLRLPHRVPSTPHDDSWVEIDNILKQVVS